MSPHHLPRTVLRSVLAIALCGAFAALPATAGAVAVPGALTQKAGLAACISDTGSGGTCTDGTGLAFAEDVAVSSDGTSVYAVSDGTGVLTIFDRDPGTGALTQKAGTAGCISETGDGGACVDGTGLDAAFAVAVSPDGENVYVASNLSDAVAVFDRNTLTGALTQLAGVAGCVSDTGTGGACTDGTALIGANGVDVSPDGASVYVTSLFSDSVAVFDRSGITGALTQKAGTAGCISDTGTAGSCTDGVALDGAQSVAVSSDGTSVYATSANANAVVAFARDAGTGALTIPAGVGACVSETGTGGACADGAQLDNPRDVAVIGSDVYVVSGNSNAVTSFDRDPLTSVLTQDAGTAGCISDTGSSGACTDGVALVTPAGVEAAPDGGSVYVASRDSNAVAAFSRDAGTGLLTQLAGLDACVSETGGSCTDGTAVSGARDVAVTTTSLYTASQISNAVAVFDREPAGDVTNPTAPGAVNDGALVPPAPDTNLTGSATTFDITWTAGTDGGSGVAGYDWCINETADCTTTPVRGGSVGAVTTVNSAGAALTDGTYLSCVRTRDNALNASAVTCSDGFSVDATAPTGGSITVADATITSAAASIAWTAGTDANVGTLALQRDTAPASGTTCGTFSGAFATTVVANLRAGSTAPFVDTTVAPGSCYRYRTVDTDLAGNAATLTGAGTITYVATSPTTIAVTATSRAGAKNVVDVAIAVTANAPGAATPTGTVTVTTGVAGVECGSALTLSGGRATCALTYPSSGTDTISVSYSGDAASSPSTATSITATARDNTPPVLAPVITSLDSSTGTVSDGTHVQFAEPNGRSIVVNGKHFFYTTTLTPGLCSSTFYVTFFQLLCVVAPQEPGTRINVQAFTPGQGQSAPTGFSVEFSAGPSISSIVPNFGPTNDITPVQVRGAQFTTSTQLTYGFAGTVRWVSSSRLDTSTSLHDGAGVTNVVATTAFGSSNAVPYTFVKPAATVEANFVLPTKIFVYGKPVLAVVGAPSSSSRSSRARAGAEPRGGVFVNIPARALATGTKVTLTKAPASAANDVPASQRLLAAYLLSWSGARAAKPVSFTLRDSAVTAGAAIWLQTPTGLRQVGFARTAGTATTTFRTSSTIYVTVPRARPAGYGFVTAAGIRYGHGETNGVAALPDGAELTKPIVAAASDHLGRGGIRVGSDGGVYAYGTTAFQGSLAQQSLAKPIVAAAVASGGDGYVLVSADGKVYPFGAVSVPSPRALARTASPVVAAALAIDAKGYLLVQANGSVRAFGTAKRFPIDRGFVAPTKSVVAIATTGTGRGYLLVTAAGKVIPYGDATYRGDLGRTKPDAKIVGITLSPNGAGYHLVSAKGTVYPFGNAKRASGASTLPKGATVAAVTY